MTNKKKTVEVETFAEKEKREYTVKITSIIKVIIIVALLGASYIAGWNSRSEFANEVKSEVRTQMSAVQSVKQ